MEKRRVAAGGPAKPTHLSDLLSAGMFTGSSLILRRPGQPAGGGACLLYGVRTPRSEGSQQILELTGIGGGFEEQDESLAQCALREAEEEMGCNVRLLLCPETVVVRGPQRVERVLLQGEERPAAVVFRRWRTPPHQPWHSASEGEACLVVFSAELSGQPWPSMELPALIWLRPGQVVDTARRDVPLRALLEAGADLVERVPGSMSGTAWVRLTDSQEALVLALGDGAQSFYEAILERCDEGTVAQR